jgi:hypothetical protein
VRAGEIVTDLLEHREQIGSLSSEAAGSA